MSSDHRRGLWATALTGGRSGIGTKAGMKPTLADFESEKLVCYWYGFGFNDQYRNLTGMVNVTAAALVCPGSELAKPPYLQMSGRHASTMSLLWLAFSDWPRALSKMLIYAACGGG